MIWLDLATVWTLLRGQDLSTHSPLADSLLDNNSTSSNHPWSLNSSLLRRSVSAPKTVWALGQATVIYYGNSFPAACLDLPKECLPTRS